MCPRALEGETLNTAWRDASVVDVKMVSATSSLPTFLSTDNGDIATFANDYRATRAVWCKSSPQRNSSISLTRSSVGSFAVVMYDWSASVLLQTPVVSDTKNVIRPHTATGGSLFASTS